MKTFCPSRGCSITYETTRPNFCPSCGSPMLGTSASQATPSRQISRPQPQNQNWDEEVEQNDYSLGPSLVKVNIAARAPQTVLADHIVGTGATGFGSRPKIPQADYKKFEKKMREEKPTPIEI